MSQSSDVELHWCVKVPIRQTQSMKQQLISLGIFLKDFMLSKDDQYSYLPILSPADLPDEWLLEQRLFEHLTRKLSYQIILQDIIPSDLHHLIPVSFDRLADIILVKIDPALTDFVKDIGMAFLKQFAVRSVFLKASEVESEFRTIHWDCIAGENNPIVIHSMHGLRWKVNIQAVYFNTRLSNEYLRVANLCHRDDIIIDMFAGIGPFSLLCARSNLVQIYAFDINPAAIDLLRENIILNQKHLTGSIISSCGDSKQLITDLPLADKIIMNLPGLASDFLPQVLPHIAVTGTIFLHQFIHQSKEEKKLSISSHQESLHASLNNLASTLNLIDYSWRITGHKLHAVSPSKTHVVWDITRLT